METVLAPELIPAITEPALLADFDAVVQLYRPGIFRFILASLRDRDAAETLAQECFLKAFRARDGFRGDASVKTWLMRIAVNLVRDHLSNARLKFWRRTQRSSVDLSVAEGWLADRRSSPEAAAHAKQQLAAIWNAVAELPDKQRMVFLLRFVEDMEILEIAAATGLKEGTVKIHLFRALRSVRGENMSEHLSSQQIEEWVIGERTPQMEEHLLACHACAEEVQRVVGPMQLFRQAVRDWSADTPPVQIRIVPRPVRWQFAVLVAALLMVIAVPVYRRNEVRRQAAATSAAVTAAAVTSAQDEILLRQVESGLARSVPAPMEPLAKLMSN